MRVITNKEKALAVLLVFGGSYNTPVSLLDIVKELRKGPGWTGDS